MKKNSMLLWMFFAVMTAMFTSCSSDDDENTPASPSFKSAEIIYKATLSSDLLYYFDVKAEYTDPNTKKTETIDVQNETWTKTLQSSVAPMSSDFKLVVSPKAGITDYSRSLKYEYRIDFSGQINDTKGGIIATKTTSSQYSLSVESSKIQAYILNHGVKELGKRTITITKSEVSL